MDKEKSNRISRMIDDLKRELAERQHNTEILKRELAEFNRKHSNYVLPDAKTKVILKALMVKISLRAQQSGKMRVAECRQQLQISATPKKLSKASLVSNRRNRVML